MWRRAWCEAAGPSPCACRAPTPMPTPSSRPSPAYGDCPHSPETRPGQRNTPPEHHLLAGAPNGTRLVATDIFPPSPGGVAPPSQRSKTTAIDKVCNIRVRTGSPQFLAHFHSPFVGDVDPRETLVRTLVVRFAVREGCEDSRACESALSPEADVQRL